LPAVSRRSGSISCSATVAPLSSENLKISVSRFLVKTTLPAPIKAILTIRNLLGRREARDTYFMPVLAIPWMK
jgi:hypothetical protein